jgi:hypothetical protein
MQPRPNQETNSPASSALRQAMSMFLQAPTVSPPLTSAPATPSPCSRVISSTTAAAIAAPCSGDSMGGSNRTSAEPGDPTATETPGLEVRSWEEEREEAGGEKLFRELPAFPWERNGGGARGAEKAGWWRFEVVMGRGWKYGRLGGVECIYFLEKLGRLKMGALPLPGLFLPFYEIF